MKHGILGLSAFLRIASALVILGLLVEIVSLTKIHPLLFALFAFVGTSLIGLGVVVYLASLVFATSPSNENQK